jgi:CYTH domain-containing protein
MQGGGDLETRTGAPSGGSLVVLVTCARAPLPPGAGPRVLAVTVELKYAHLERERRFLLASAPSGLAPRRSLVIQDRYLQGTRLRLRVVEEQGRARVYKLGQKVRLDESSAADLAHTTMYLSDTEFAVLAGLPADTLEKTRHLVDADADADGVTVAVDCFHGVLAGLVLAEVDLGVGGSMPSPVPGDPVMEVTTDERFTGGALAVTSSSQLRRMLADYGLA